MAVSVNTVYQKVLALANKEQRGYITPQEFNLFADHAQKDIFRQYFYDLDQARRRTGNNTRYGDLVTTIEEKISLFEQYDQPAAILDGEGNVNLKVDFPDIYKVTRVVIDGSYGGIIEVEQVQLKELSQLSNSSLVNNVIGNTGYCAYYTLTGQDDQKRMKIWPHPASGSNVRVSYIREPGHDDNAPNWTYLISGESALFNPDPTKGWRDFELHSSEENALVIKILQLAGINIKDASLVQAATQEEIKKIQQEKQ